MCSDVRASGASVSSATIRLSHAMAWMGIVVLLPLLAGDASGEKIPKSKPISNYMRDVGLMYLEEIENLHDKCLDFSGAKNSVETADNCDSARSESAKILDALERRIDLTLRESRRPTGDMPFFKLLQDTRVGESLFLSSFIGQSFSPRFDWDKHVSGYLNCEVHAEQDMKTGFTEAYSRIQSSSTVATDDDNCLDGGQGIPSPPRVGKDADTCSTQTSCEAEARSWRTQAKCEEEGFVFADGICHAKSK